MHGVGQARAGRLSSLGITTVADLLWHLPNRYQDFTSTKLIADVVPGEPVTIVGEVISVEDKPTSRDPRLWITIARIRDDSGVAEAVWFTRTKSPKLRPRFSPAPPRGALVYLSGVAERAYGKVSFANPEWEDATRGVEGEPLNTARVVPVYGLTEGLGQKAVRRIVSNALSGYGDEIREVLPFEVLGRYGLPERRWAFLNVHFPSDMASASLARRRLTFEELFLLRLALKWRKSQYKASGTGLKHGPDGQLVAAFMKNLPFALTRAQEKVIREIAGDMEGPTPMARLVQGDVGSGKTVVAAYALVKTVENGYQGAMMAPTEILAEQHLLSLKKLLGPLGISVYLISGSQSQKERQEALTAARSGAAQVVVGTHALIQGDVEFSQLGLAITDEQHRFGVTQRAILAAKGGRPHVLVMSATPIPRTLAMAIYGDLDVSVIDELPPGRIPVETHWVMPSQRPRVYQFVREQVSRGRQAYIVCPLVEESEALSVKAAASEAEILERDVFPDLKVGLLHGRMSSSEKDAVMTDFRDGRIDILISTTVIEVGVDVPNASVMVIEDAERFGLAQLHQLRGRVGRGRHRGYCILVSQAASEVARQRMQVMQRTSDGFEIAEQDLRLRGPGEFFGTRQHGLPDLNVDILPGDLRVLAEAIEAAEGVDIEELGPGRRLEQLGHEISRRFGGMISWTGV